MERILLVIVFYLFTITSSYSQDNIGSILANNNTNKIENFILTKELDSASYYISQQTPTSYLVILNRISKNNSPTYLDYHDYISSLENRSEILYKDFLIILIII